MAGVKMEVVIVVVGVLLGGIALGGILSIILGY